MANLHKKAYVHSSKYSTKQFASFSAMSFRVYLMFDNDLIAYVKMYAKF